MWVIQVFGVDYTILHFDDHVVVLAVNEAENMAVRVEGRTWQEAVNKAREELKEIG